LSCRRSSLYESGCHSGRRRENVPIRDGNGPSRLPTESVTYWTTKALPVRLDRANLNLAQSAHGVALYVEGVADRKIAFATKISAGNIHRLASEISWVLDGLHWISTVSELGCSQAVSNQIGMLSRRVRWGAPAEALDVIRVADRHRVPGFGRQRAMALAGQGITTLHDVLAAGIERLTQLLRSAPRAGALLEADELGRNGTRRRPPAERP